MKPPKYFYFRVKTDSKATEIILEDASDCDVVEVVRCRECKHHDGIRCFRWNSVIVTRFDDYCSSGERKDGGQDDV